MNVDQLLPWSELLKKLVQLCTERRTGTLFIATDDNRLARFALKNGVIAAVAFQRKQGMPAVEMMQSVIAGKWRFNDQMMLVSGVQSLPSTPELLQILADETSFDLVLPHSEPAPAASTSRASQPPSAPASSGGPQGVEQWFSFVDISELLRIKEIIATGLIEIMGPMGRMVCDEHLAALTDSRSVMMAIERLAEEIDDAELERQFKMSIAEKLQGFQKSRK